MEKTTKKGGEYKYYAFISYNKKDTAWGKRLKRKLEGYRMPTVMCSEHGWERKPIKPVFFAPYDIQLGELSPELQKKLRASRNLIVICSPNSAQSKWVGKEIAFFHSLGRKNNIYFFIVDGIPNSGNPETECFNHVIKNLGMAENLGADIHEKVFPWPWLNRERAYIQLITTLLGIEFDSLWKSHKRYLIQQIAAWTIGIIAVLAALLGVWVMNQPVDVSVGLNETSVHNSGLPPLKDAVVCMELENETKTETIKSLDAKAIFANIPHKALGKNIHLTVACHNWLSVDTSFILTKEVVINMSRNPNPYGDVIFRLWSIDKEQGVANIQVSLAGQSATSDAEGYVKMFIPLNRQSERYKVECSLPLEENVLSMPTTESTVLIVK